jgi:hypothetical protein
MLVGTVDMQAPHYEAVRAGIVAMVKAARRGG